MRRLAIVALAALAATCGLADEDPLLAAGPVVTNVVSNSRMVKGWRRTFVLGEAGGTLKDASGTIADYARGAAIEASAERLPEIVEAAFVGMTNALTGLYAVTNNITNIVQQVFVAGDLAADDLERDNLYAYIAGEYYDGASDWYAVWFNRELASPPEMQWRYTTEIGEWWSQGNWELPWSASAVEVNGFSGCHWCEVPRPADIAGITVRANAYPRFGAAEKSFDFARRRFFLTEGDGSVTNLPWSGIWTNAEQRVFQWINGVFMGEVADE